MTYMYMCIFIVVVIRSNMAAWQPFCLQIFHVQSHNSDMLEQISFKVGIRTVFYDIHVHIHCCHDTIQYGRLAAILFVNFHVQSHNSDMLEQISFKVGIRTVFYDIHVHIHFRRDTIQYGCLAAILFVNFPCPKP